jgi:hypothetical protein
MGQIFRTFTVRAVLLPQGVAACAALSPFAVDSLVAADIILTGEVTGYQDLYSAPGAALVTVQVAEVIKGEAGAEIALIWAVILRPLCDEVWVRPLTPALLAEAKAVAAA